MMTMKNVNLIGLRLFAQFQFPSLELLIKALPDSKIKNICLLGDSFNLTMTSRHVYHLILLIYNGKYLQEVNLGGNIKLSECVPLLLTAVTYKNIKILHFGDMIRDHQLLEMAPILQSNNTLRYLNICFLNSYYSFESLSKFVETITAPESISQLEHLVTSHDSNRELTTVHKKFSERRGFSLRLYSDSKRAEQFDMGFRKIMSLPESLITGRT